MTLIEQPVEERVAAAPRSEPTVWGLSLAQLHDRFWASRGVQVVRMGEPSTIVDDAELFMLTDPRMLLTLNIRRVVEKMIWLKPDVLIVRLANTREEQYRETAMCAPDGTFIRYQRRYGGWDARLARVCFTRDKDLARDWQNASEIRSIWQEFRKKIRQQDRSTVRIRGRVYDRTVAAETAQFVRDLVADWKRPDTTISGIGQVAPGVWAWEGTEGSSKDVATQVDRDIEFTGPLWIGAGRKVGKEQGRGGIFGPAALWDAAGSRPVNSPINTSALMLLVLPWSVPMPVVV